MRRDLKSQLHELDLYKGDIVIDLAGKDSYAAIISYLEKNAVSGKTLVPVVVKTPTEYGNDEQLYYSFNKFQEAIIKSFEISFAPILFIEEPLLWKYLNGRFIVNTIKNYDFYSPCPGCHIYIHAVRAYVTQKLGIGTIISGERLAHSSKVKLNQLEISIRSHAELMEKFSIGHVQPIKDIADDLDINNRINKYFDISSIYHFDCVFSSNYREMDGNVAIPPKLAAYYQLCIKLAHKYFQIFQLNEKEIEKEMLALIINENQ